MPTFEGAVCAEPDINPDLWYSETYVGQREAVRQCRTCQWQASCLTVALEDREEFGVWGAMLPSQRDRLLTRRAAR